MNLFRTIHETIHDEIIPRIRFGFFYPFAKAGVISAQLSIANILFYRYRSWEPKNPEQWVEKLEALEWYKKSALTLSHEWHTKAAVAGYPKAMSEEGNFIIHGWVSGRLEDAFDYYSRAYDAGYKPASRGLGDCYFYGWGTERNREKALFFYKIARRSGFGINLKELQKMTEEEFQQVDGDEALEGVRRCYN